MISEALAAVGPLLIAGADPVAGSSGWAQTVGALSVALVAAYFAYKQATRVAREQAASARTAARATAETEAKRIEAGAYERAKGLIEAGAKHQAVELQRVEAKLAAEEGRSERLRTRVLELEDEVARLRRRLIVAGLDETPPPAVG